MINNPMNHPILRELRQRIRYWFQSHCEPESTISFTYGPKFPNRTSSTSAIKSFIDVFWIYQSAYTSSISITGEPKNKC